MSSKYTTENRFEKEYGYFRQVIQEVVEMKTVEE
jgi:hypothetical protein